MNIAPSNTATPPTPATAAAPDSAGDVAASPGAAPQAFGKLLSKSIAHGDATAPSGSGLDRPVVTTGDAGKDTTALTSDASAADGTTTARTSKSDDPATDPIGTDLAAQLALVSQWTGPAVHPQNAAAAGDPTTPAATNAGDSRTAIAATAAQATDPTAATDAARVATDAATDPAADPATAAALASTGARPTSNATRAAAPPLPGLSSAIAAALRGGDVGSVDLVKAVAAKSPASEAPTATTSGLAHAALTDPTVAGALSGQAGTQSPAQLVAQIASQLASQMAAPGVSQTGAAAQPAATPTPLAAPSDLLRETVGTAAWSHEVGQATLRMAANDLQNVSLRLNPEHLGPMDVQMRVDNGIAHLQFTAAHLDTRQALEASRTTLHQMFNEQGIRLGDWSVGQQSANASSARDFGSARSQGSGRDGPAADGADAQSVSSTVTVRTTPALGLVDTFA